jgi:TctA family transporter
VTGTATATTATREPAAGAESGPPRTLRERQRGRLRGRAELGVGLLVLTDALPRTVPVVVGAALLLVLNLPLAPVRAKLLRVPRPYLYAGILFFAAVGAYAVGGQAIDLVILFVIGLIGLLMRRFGLPLLPAGIGVILGPAAELQMRRALQLSDGSLTGLVNTPFAVTVYVLIAPVVAWPWLRRALPRSRRDARPPPGD